MGSGMPYHREKGDTWESFDSFFSHRNLNIRARHKLATLEHLWNPTSIGRFTEMAEPQSPATPYVQDGASPTVVGPGVWQTFFKGLVYHANVDWFGSGIPTDPTGAPVTALDPGPTDSYYEPVTPKPKFGVDPGQVLTNGWWKNWFGENTERIVRDTYIRAIEVSLGLSHPDAASVAAAQSAATDGGGGEIISRLYFLPHGNNGAIWTASLVGTDNESKPAFKQLSRRFSRNWPIDFWWTCGMPWFQGWVSWAESEGNPVPHPSVSSGRVVVTWLTPGSTLHTLYRDLTGLPHAQEAKVVAGAPTEYDDDRFGSWLIAHQKNDVVNNISYFPTHAGETWPFPISTNYSYQDVVTIDPPLGDGGIGQPSDLASGLELF